MSHAAPNSYRSLDLFLRRLGRLCRLPLKLLPLGIPVDSFSSSWACGVVFRSVGPAAGVVALEVGVADEGTAEVEEALYAGVDIVARPRPCGPLSRLEEIVELHLQESWEKFSTDARTEGALEVWWK